jgi:hypothetical protein
VDKSSVYVVHCIDTEGPLYESVDATFERLRNIFHLDLEPSAGLLRQLQAGQVPLGGLEAAVQKVLDPALLAYNDTWDKVDEMLAELMHDSFRTQIRDSCGAGWIYNWFCVDHVDYDANPRRRDMGYHNVFEHYRRMIRETGSIHSGGRLIAVRRIGGHRPIVCTRFCHAESLIIIGFRQHIALAFM